MSQTDGDKDVARRVFFSGPRRWHFLAMANGNIKCQLKANVVATLHLVVVVVVVVAVTPQHALTKQV